MNFTLTPVRTAWESVQIKENLKVRIETRRSAFPFRYEDFKTRNVSELEDAESWSHSGAGMTPVGSTNIMATKRNRLCFSIKQGDQVIAVNFFQPTLSSRQNWGSADSGDFWGNGTRLKVFDRMKLLAHGRWFAAGLSSDARSQPNSREIGSKYVSTRLDQRRECAPSLTRALSTHVFCLQAVQS